MRTRLVVVVLVVFVACLASAVTLRDRVMLRRGPGTQVADELSESVLRRLSKHVSKRAAADLPDVVRRLDEPIDEFLKRLARESGAEVGEQVTESVLKAAAKKALGEIGGGRAISENVDMLMRATTRKLDVVTKDLASGNAQAALKYMTDFELQLIKEIGERKKLAPLIPSGQTGYFGVEKSRELADFYRRVSKNQPLSKAEAEEVVRLVEKVPPGPSSSITAFEMKLRDKATQMGAYDQAYLLVHGKKRPRVYDQSNWEVLHVDTNTGLIRSNKRRNL